MDKRLLNLNQSGFCPVDSVLISFLQYQMRYLKPLIVFTLLKLDQSFKADQKPSTKFGLLHKRKSMSIFGEFGRFQRVTLNGQTSSWKPVLAGVPQS